MSGIPKELYIVCNKEFGEYKIHFDKPELCKDGIFRSLNGQWTDIPDKRWFLDNLKPGHYLKFKLAEEDL